MVNVAIGCHKSSAMSFQRCPLFTAADLAPSDVEAWVERTLAENGWIRDGETYYCPQHNPAITGEVVTVGPEYVELAPGVFVRNPEANPYPHEIEVRFVAPGASTVVPSAYFDELATEDGEPDEPNERVRAAAKRLHEVVVHRDAREHAKGVQAYIDHLADTTVGKMEG